MTRPLLPGPDPLLRALRLLLGSRRTRQSVCTRTALPERSSTVPDDVHRAVWHWRGVETAIVPCFSGGCQRRDDRIQRGIPIPQPGSAHPMTAWAAV